MHHRLQNYIKMQKKNDGWFTLISNSFYFGYMQGVKATKAQLKGGAR